MMEFGLVTLGDWLPDPATGVRVSQHERFRHIVSLGPLAEAHGFTALYVGEHHFSEYALSAPPVVLAAIAERTTTLRLSTAVTLLPHLDAVRVAEDYATVDVLSGGRVELVAGRGVYQNHYGYFTGSWDESNEMLVEGVSLLRDLWTNQDVHWSGRWRAPLDGVSIQPRPIQLPHPPIWLSASSFASVERAVSLRCPIVIPTISTGVTLPAELANAYRSSWASAGHDPTDAKIALHVHGYIGETDDVAARDRWAPYQHGYLGWVLRSIRGHAAALPPSFEVSDRPDAQAVCGSATFVAAELSRRVEAMGGVDRLLVQCDQGGLPAVEVAACVERLGSLLDATFG